MSRASLQGPEGSVIKLAWSLTDQALANTAVNVLGMDALSGGWATNQHHQQHRNE